MTNRKSNLIDHMIDFWENALSTHWHDCFGNESEGWKDVAKYDGILAMYMDLPHNLKSRFETYLLNCWAHPEFPDVEWAPIGEYAIIPDTDTETKVIK